MPEDEFCMCIYNYMFTLLFMLLCAFLLYIAGSIESTPLIMFLSMKAVTGALLLMKLASIRNHSLFLPSLSQFRLPQSTNL